MSLLKECADNLRVNYTALTGNRLGASHAHEVAAAYFGFQTAAALRAEKSCPIAALTDADFLIPDLKAMDARIQKIQRLPADLPPIDELATCITDFLLSAKYFNGHVWQERDLSDSVNGYVQSDPMMIENDLSGETASTNAYFEELYIDEYEFEANDDALIVTLYGSLNGETHEDKVFHGDKIKFSTVMTFDRVAGRIGFAKPRLETDGEVDMEGYYDPE
jgi:hypothetical protein